MNAHPFDVGDIVVKAGPAHKPGSDIVGVVVLAVPAMASPYKLFMRWLDGKGVWHRGSPSKACCRDHESYFIRVGEGPKADIYWPPVCSLRKAAKDGQN